METSHNRAPKFPRVGPEHCSVFGKHVFSVLCSEFMFGSEHCLNTPSEHFFISKKGGGAEGAAPFFAREDVFARSVQTVFRSEYEFRTSNTEHMFSEHRTVFRANPGQETIVVVQRKNEKHKEGLSSSAAPQAPRGP